MLLGKQDDAQKVDAKEDKKKTDTKEVGVDAKMAPAGKKEETNDETKKADLAPKTSKSEVVCCKMDLFPMLWCLFFFL